MENKKLLNILQKDMNELEELIAEIKEQGNFNAFEMEFVHTKAKGVVQLIHLLNNVNSKNGNDEIPIENEKIEELKETVSEIQEEVRENLKDSVQEDVNVQKEPEIKSEGEELHIVKDSEMQTDKDEEMKEVPVSSDLKEEDKIDEHQEADDEDDDMLEAEDNNKKAGSTLGDSFLKGRSINDILTDQNKLEFKLSNRPVESIKTAIGINDRFQYIRELFDGSPEKFADAVQTLDSKQNIKEAVDYLRHNFKWKKSETSLKFVNLVKRRFQND